ncbi:MAG TPA: 5'/3'-nucleotidase SurE [Phycisphaerales bacterium]|nr:5'/3'-nucleotidase SurE [Phycisphaerales bacterium]
MRILLTNDDGIRAPGIIALYDALTDSGGHFGAPLGGPDSTVFPIAPLTAQSATGHGLTVHTPLMITQERVTQRMSGIAVDGRPADCVKLAVSDLWPDTFGKRSRPDLVISGMNSGANVGINVIYSGTVAAALEAAFLGIPSIAVSLHMGSSQADFPLAARHGRRAIEAIVAAGLPTPHTCLSVNIPITELGAPPSQTSHYPIRVCPMNTHGLNDKYEKRTSPGGEVYYWAAGHGLDFRTTTEGSDVQELFNRCITVTPLRYDLTKKSIMDTWRDRLKGAASKA